MRKIRTSNATARAVSLILFPATHVCLRNGRGAQRDEKQPNHTMIYIFTANEEARILPPFNAFSLVFIII